MEYVVRISHFFVLLLCGQRERAKRVQTQPTCSRADEENARYSTSILFELLSQLLIFFVLSCMFFFALTLNRFSNARIYSVRQRANDMMLHTETPIYDRVWQRVDRTIHTESQRGQEMQRQKEIACGIARFYIHDSASTHTHSRFWLLSK